LLVAVAGSLGDDRGGGGRGPAGLGEPVQDGQFEFVVRSVDCGARLVGEGVGRKPALGQFCLVGLRVENTGGEGRTFGVASSICSMTVELHDGPFSGGVSVELG